MRGSRTQRWLDRLAELWSGVWRWLLLATGLSISLYLLLDRGAGNGVVLALALCGLVIGAALTGSHTMAIPLMATPALFVAQRVGLGSTDLSVSDVALAAAFGTAVLLGNRAYSRHLKTLLWLNLVYQFASLFTVFANPHTTNTVEWFHAWLLVSGALIVGWALGRAGHARAAFALMLIATTIMALGTLGTALFRYASGDFSAVYPQWPFEMHKNAAGTFMAFTALIAYLNPSWARLPVRWVRPVFWLLIVAIITTQSRQALVGLIAAFIVISLRRGASSKSRATALLAIPGIWLVTATVLEQIESQNRFNSAFQRLNWLREVYAFWKESPVFGHGLRYWYRDDVTANFQPPQAELEVAASAGIVGLAAFVAMWVGILIVLWRIDPSFGTLAFAVVLSRIVQAQFDLFWIAGQVSVPFVVAGVCVGAMALADSSRVDRGSGQALRNASPQTQSQAMA